MGFRLGSMLSFYVAADDYIYGTRIDETLQAENKTQNDVHLAVGFGVPSASKADWSARTSQLDYRRSRQAEFRHRGG